MNGKQRTNNMVVGAVMLQEPDVTGNPAVDAFGRQRVSAPIGLFENKFLSGKNHNIWDENLYGCIITHGAVTGTFTVGQTITGVTSTSVGVITAVNAGSITYNSFDNEFVVGETITTPSGSSVVVTINTGAVVEYDYFKASVFLRVGTLAGQKVIRQTYRYFPYVSGFSHLINTTQVFNQMKAGLKQTVMYGDSLNGLGIVLQDTTVNLLLRTNTSGSPVDTLVPQMGANGWNIDNLSGLGEEYGNPSGIKLDTLKRQILSIDFQWLGVGRVRVGLNIDGVTRYVHEFENSNVTVGVYMRTPTLPIRYEIENTANTESASSLQQICSSVSSEGGYSVPGIEFSTSHGVAERTLSAGVKTPVLAIRLKTQAENNGRPVRTTVKLLNAGLYARAADIYFELVHVHDPISVTGNWADKDDSSMVRVSKDITALTAKHQHEIEGKMVPTGGSTQAAGEGTIDTNTINNHLYLNQNIQCDNSQMFVIYATSRAGTGYCTAHITFLESE